MADVSERPQHPPLDTEPEATTDDDTVRERLWKTLAAVSEPTKVSIIAEMADCSTQGARDALRDFEEMGFVVKAGESPVRYRKNPAYFQFLRGSRLAQDTTPRELWNEFVDRFDTHLRYVERFEAPTPEAVDTEAVFEAGGEEALETLREWEAVYARLDDLREAYRQQTGTVVPRPAILARYTMRQRDDTHRLAELLPNDETLTPAAELRAVFGQIADRPAGDIEAELLVWWAVARGGVEANGARG